ncbi:MAG: ATP-binding protein [Ginsengibacter sp.]
MAYQGIKNKLKSRPLRIIYIFYWFLLAYIVAALVFWFIALNIQNEEIYSYKMRMIEVNDLDFQRESQQLKEEKDRKTTQYIGEGATFLLLIVAGAVFVFRIIKKQLVLSKQQQNFMMAITHELKTPIAVTKLNLETMQIRKLDHDQQQKLIRSTIQESNRLNALCNNMLLLSQIDTGGYIFTNEKIDLGALATDCAEDFLARFSSRRIEVSTEDEIFINGDKLLLQLAINNLLDNAIKYSPKDTLVLLRVFYDHKKIHFQVIDEGQGVPEKEQDKIFEKYFRGAQMQTKGTGLGLYLTREIVRQHNGNISLTDNKPHGCIFEMQFKNSKFFNH